MEVGFQPWPKNQRRKPQMRDNDSISHTQLY